MIETVTIGEKNMFLDYGCILSHKSIESPKVQTKYVDIPMRDGMLDLTEVLSGDIKYGNREIKLDFIYVGNNINDLVNDIYNYMHGKRMHISFSYEPDVYFEGRVLVDSTNILHKEVIKISLNINTDPFKYRSGSYDLDFSTDITDLVNGTIDQQGRLVIDGTTSFVWPCSDKKTLPTFTVSDSMSLTFGGETFDLSAGDNEPYGLILKQGNNSLSFDGDGTLSISYVGGNL